LNGKDRRGSYGKPNSDQPGSNALSFEMGDDLLCNFFGKDSHGLPNYDRRHTQPWNHIYPAYVLYISNSSGGRGGFWNSGTDREESEKAFFHSWFDSQQHCLPARFIILGIGADARITFLLLPGPIVLLRIRITGQSLPTSKGDSHFRGADDCHLICIWKMCSKRMKMKRGHDEMIIYQGVITK